MTVLLQFNVAGAVILGNINVARKHNFPKNLYFKLPDTRAYQGTRNVSFSENCACVQDDDILDNDDS